jgi:6-phosphogluconate dehydrogenase
MKKYDIAVIGLGVMGQSLARNLANHKFQVIGWDRHREKEEDFLKKYGEGHLDICADFRCVREELKKPRMCLIMVPSGAAVDEVIEKVLPVLEPGDILIDGGNSYFKDTIRRKERCDIKKVEFVGLGISGGEEGALKGPSFMPGCSEKAWKKIRPLLSKIAAKDFAGKPCITRVGSDGAGHYVKMVHNAIEYGVMQMMAEAYDILRKIYGLKAPEIGKIFAGYNKGRLKSYLFEISVPVLTRLDESKKGYLVDYILDTAKQKGTGKWASMDALNRGAVLTTATAAVFERNLSFFKKLRLFLSKFFRRKPKKPMPLAKFTKLLEGALYAGMISSYAQGFELMRVAAEEQKWKLNFAEIARIWEGGCIIRAKLLNVIHKAFKTKKGKPVHLFEIPAIRSTLQNDAEAFRQVVSAADLAGVPTSALSAAHNYFEAITQENLPANFIQALRDYFGAHTYERIDKPGTFHTSWVNSDS